MYTENKELIEEVIKNISNKFQSTEEPEISQLSREQLINKLIIAESTIQVVKQENKVLEWENNIWNREHLSKSPKHPYV
ncbi:MAG: hypothetical protein H7Z13_08470 [Ferruginibacter sp.]|nr:hypothetical protein [Ferruginibacter sp.]